MDYLHIDHIIQLGNRSIIGWENRFSGTGSYLDQLGVYWPGFVLSVGLFPSGLISYLLPYHPFYFISLPCFQLHLQ